MLHQCLSRSYHLIFPSFQVLQDEFVALLCPQYNERPQVAKVKKVHPESVTVEWYDGSWTSSWKLYRYKLGRKTMTWEEDVLKKDAIDKVNFTKSMRLTAQTIRKLKSLY